MERACGRPKFGWYLGGACLIFLARLAEPALLAGLPIRFYSLAAACCLLRWLFGPDRTRPAAWLVLALLMLASEAQWLARWAEPLLFQLVVGCLLVAPALAWLAGKRSFLPPPECALAVIVLIAQTLLLALLMPGETLFSIGRFAEAGLGLLFLCWCCSLALTGPRLAAGIARHEVSESAALRQQRELLQEAIRTARAYHADRLRVRAAPHAVHRRTWWKPPQAGLRA